MPKSNDRTSNGPPPGGSDPGGPRRGFARPWPLIATAAAAVAITVAVALAITGLTAGPPPKDQALTDRVGAIVSELNALETRLKSAPDPKDIAALGTRLAAIEAQIADLARRPAPPAADPNKITALDGRLDEVAKRLAAVEQMGHRLDEITAQIAKIETALAHPSEADPAVLARVAAVDTAVKSLLGRMTELEKRLDTLAAIEREASARPPVMGTSDQAIRIAFLATALRTAVERGAPFIAELAALKTLASDSDKASLALLEAFAANGVPSTKALSHELSALVPALLAAANPAQGDGSLMDRLGMTTRRLVRIRRVGDAPGDDPVSVIARIEVKAAHDDIAGALAEFAKLPEGVRTPAAAWIKKATQRIAAVEAAQRLAADALAGLAKSAP